MNPPPTPATTVPLLLHPYCRTCGWRKGGVDSWDGARCKCGYREPPIETRMAAPETKQ